MIQKRLYQALADENSSVRIVTPHRRRVRVLRRGRNSFRVIASGRSPEAVSARLEAAHCLDDVNDLRVGQFRENRQ
jgi:hypothetical protein